MKDYIKEYILEKKWDFMDADLLAVIIHALTLIVICFLVYWLAKKLIISRVHKIASKTKGKWDDHLMNAHFFRRIILLLPLFIFRYSVDAVMADYHTSIPLITKLFEVLIAIASMRIVIAFINALQTIVSSSDSYKDKPIQSYAQVLKIIVWLFFGITLFSVITGKTPMFFLTAMGAMSAIILLIFRDTLLGFIGSIQLATNDMVRLGDWISMEKYGADGNVIEINLTTIKVRNFDLTITTIPTYALISDSFKNWRGMEESAGRRMKRALKIKMDSVRFLGKEQIEHFGSMRLLKSHIETKEKEIAEFNSTLERADGINGRNLTNLGVFRAYIENYLHDHPEVNDNLTCMVRQLEPGPEGIPIEIYAFSKDKRWVHYEGIMADIFDHIIAIVPEFDLEIFQSPTGSDIKKLAQ
ncbi:MAG: mechanosensitive ion channel family protein [Bacteroidia bacterium]